MLYIECERGVGDVGVMVVRGRLSTELNLPEDLTVTKYRKQNEDIGGAL